VSAAALALLSLVSINVSSRLTEAEKPELALKLNPLNSDARANVLARALGDNGLAEATIVGIAQAGVHYAPADARFVSVLGELARRNEDPAQARALFEIAHSLSKTEILALRNLINDQLAAASWDEAVASIDLLLRRWPAEFGSVLAIMPALLSSDDGYGAIRARLVQAPPWRSRLIAELARQPEAVDYAVRLAVGLNADGLGSSAEIDAVVAGLLRAGRSQEAHRVFRVTRDTVDRERLGFVHNASFSPPRSAAPYDWRFATTASADIRHLPEGSGLIVRFLNRPATDIRLRQTVVLPQGRYRLIIDAQASALVAPRGLFWRLRCEGANSVIAEAALQEGTYGSSRITTEFEVASCQQGTLSLGTNAIAESFRHRYSGLVSFSSVRIERL
jgi:hypothetical protein